ncbi:MAG: TPM domain-containing protein [Chitinophagales bacterium]|nr:TPM domain-containing protein [Chitinophagales bacterium]
MPTAESFFSEEQRARIVDAIREAELNTSGEIKVHLEDHAQPNALERAKFIFTHLDIAKTELRNGVLIYLAVKDHQFAILGDSGIDKAVPIDFWDEVRNTMQDYFRKGDFDSGLCEGIRMAGEQLKHYFPYQHGKDSNELSDDISFRKGR